jgi:hypothetical protein
LELHPLLKVLVPVGDGTLIPAEIYAINDSLDDCDPFLKLFVTQ